MMKPIVVKIGGSLLGSGDTCLEDMVTLQKQGLPLVVVHGGGKALTEWQTRLGLKTQFVRGLRVTDKDSLPVVVAVLAGLVNTDLVAQVNILGGKAIGLSGVDGRLIEAEIQDKELGFVGRILRVNPQPVLSLLKEGYIPFIAPIGLDIKNGGPLNINADTVAGEVAVALGAERLIFLSDVPGVLGENGEPIVHLDHEDAHYLMAKGVIATGMLPKVEACFRARQNGTICRLIDGRESHILLQEMAGQASGTTV